MHAIQPLHDPVHSVEPRRRRSTRQLQVHRQSHSHRELAVEAGVKLSVNLVLAIAASVALGRLLVYNLSQQSQLQELRAEISAVQARVDQRQAEFDQQFDSHQAERLMQEEGNRVRPGQYQVVWLSPPDISTTASAPETPIPSP